MAYTDNVREGSYTSPSGAIFNFNFDELEREGAKKASIKELVEQNQADVQDLGNTTDRFPFELYFTGDDYQTIADAFYDSLKEKGPGVLNHPRWGDISVLPLTYSQREGFVEDMRRAIFTLQFIKTSEFVNPVPSDQAALQVQALLDDLEFNLGPEAYNEELNIDALADKAQAKQNILGSLGSVNNNLRAIAAIDPNIFDEFQATYTSMVNNIDTLLNAPLSLATNAIRLTRIPGKVVTSFREKFKGFATVAETLFNVAFPDETRASRNGVINNELFAAGLFSGTVESVFSSSYQTKDEVSRAVFDMENFYNDMITYFDARQEQFEDYLNDFQYILDQQTLNQFNQLLQLSKSYLFQLSFDLKAEKIIKTTSERTPLDLCFELYGTAEQLDFSIETNNFVDEEILLIPTGRQVVYYV